MSDETVWAICELMGHVKLAGRLTEEEKFGSKMARLDIPDGDGFITQYFTGNSVYRISIVTEEVARAAAKKTAPAPVQPWDWPKQLASPVESHGAHADGWDSDNDQEDDQEDRDTSEPF